MAKKAQNSPSVGPGGQKRALIAAAEKNMFLWLSVSAVIVSFCLVGVQFLVREAWFNQKVIGAKMHTDDQLTKNIKAAQTLSNDLKNLVADEGLVAVGQKSGVTNDKASNLKVILDALPVEGDSTGFANSLQKVILPKSGVGISELSTGADTAAVVTGGDSSQPQLLPFQIGFNGDYKKVTDALVDMSHVIRPINLTDLSIRSGDDRSLTISAKGNTYYLPSKTIDVKLVECKQKDCKL